MRFKTEPSTTPVAKKWAGADETSALGHIEPEWIIVSARERLGRPPAHLPTLPHPSTVI